MNFLSVLHKNTFAELLLLITLRSEEILPNKQTIYSNLEFLINDEIIITPSSASSEADFTLLVCFLCVVLRHGQAFSPIYRFSLSDGTIVSAHTKSKLVRSPATNEPQLYMSLHILQRYTVCLCLSACAS